MRKTLRNKKGITLIALVITIVVLLILAGITINVLFSDDGIIEKAQKAADKWENAEKNEVATLNDFIDEVNEIIDEINRPSIPSGGSYSEIKKVNTPKVTEEMVPVKWSTNKNSWVVCKKEDSTWYDYTTENKQWANIMLKDGLKVEGIEDVNEATLKEMAGKKVTTVGSMFVWIPRYAYQIESGYHQSGTEINSDNATIGAGNVNIDFMRGTTNIGSSGRTSWSNESGQGNWVIHPAFKYFENDEPIPGIWVAKFEASSAEGNTESAEGDDVITKTLQIKPGVDSWRYIRIGNSYTVCLNYNKKLNSHMMKNSEWGAVAYLTQSAYGKDGEVAANTNGFTTGGGTGNAYISNIAQSTTGNIYGIYDMSGGTWECVAAYIEDGNSNGTSLVNGKSYTKEVYSSYSELKYGDAVYETSSDIAGNNSWYSDSSDFPKTSHPYFARSGVCALESESGLFYFACDSGIPYSADSFRPVLVP